MKSPVCMPTSSRNPLLWMVAITLLVCLLVPDTALAAGGSTLPWDGPLKALRDGISGPVAFTIALLGIIACGATLIWGGEISEFTRRIIYVVLVICLIVFANSMMSSLFGTQGAVIPGDMAVAATLMPSAGWRLYHE